MKCLIILETVIAAVLLQATSGTQIDALEPVCSKDVTPFCSHCLSPDHTKLSCPLLKLK
ncbi:hypothetical protein PGT21_014860 [Puccinia graminis f. sp. tritici]|uniref:Uncharacterized protein n=1 Tax=Puccinia graminis f. sp. tritici TaxID=56615 RepID=A0A5B0N5S9_PUCGR|nr:hypothetical protein PGTUg99_021262 [Puccinia graminis f. sp. tritici]KAA1094245.1 hypothetical protein PGT21_014860 [Puccinia graminis f. sp. tritici]